MSERLISIVIVCFASGQRTLCKLALVMCTNEFSPLEVKTGESDVRNYC